MCETVYCAYLCPHEYIYNSVHFAWYVYSSDTAGKFLPNALPAAYRSTISVAKKSITQTGIGWEFSLSDIKLSRTGT